MRMALVALCGAVAAAAVMTGCSSDPLTMEERLQVMVQTNKQLQLELFERDRRIAELAGGQTTIQPQHSVGELRPGAAAVEDPFKAMSISFSRLTAGYRGEGPGDEGLRVVFAPEDSSGDVVKRAGSAEIDLYDLALAGADQRIGHWDFTVDQLSHYWVSGMGINTYSLKLKWQNGTPKHRELTLMVRFVTLDGRSLMQQTHFKVDVPEAGAADGAPASAPGDGKSGQAAPPATGK
jgi:hypothetical protein